MFAEKLAQKAGAVNVSDVMAPLFIEDTGTLTGLKHIQYSEASQQTGKNTYAVISSPSLGDLLLTTYNTIPMVRKSITK